jgi:hypothetical protein
MLRAPASSRRLFSVSEDLHPIWSFVIWGLLLINLISFGLVIWAIARRRWPSLPPSAGSAVNDEKEQKKEGPRA